jgi:hypothetical protein
MVGRLTKDTLALQKRLAGGFGMLREMDVLEAGFKPTQVPVLSDAYVQALSVVERCRPVDEALEARLAEAILAEAQRRVKLGLGLRHRYDANVLATMAAGFLFHEATPTT